MELRVKGRVLKHFNKIQLALKYDAMASSFSIEYFYNQKNPDLSEVAEIADFDLIEIIHNKEVLLLGYILNHNFKDKSNSQLTTISGYTKSGILQDSTIPTKLYPLEFNNISLKDIAEKLLKPFGISLFINNNATTKANEIISTVTAKITDSIQTFLGSIANQKNINITHTKKGSLIFEKTRSNQKPSFYFYRSKLGISINLNFKGQSMHSDITIIKQDDQEQKTIKNPFVPIYKPLTKIQTKGINKNTIDVAKNILSKELKNITVNITVDRWEIDGVLITPNKTCIIHNKTIGIPNETLFFIESVILEEDNKKQTAQLTCVLPEVYSGNVPQNIFKL